MRPSKNGSLLLFYPFNSYLHCIEFKSYMHMDFNISRKETIVAFE